MVLTSTTAAASEAGMLGGAAGSGNRGMEAWEGVCRRRGSGGVGGELVARAGAAGAASERAGGGMRRRQRGRAEEGARVEGEAGHGYRTVGVAGAWSPRGGRALTRSGRDARERRGATQRRPDAGAGLGRTRGARAAGAAAGRAGFGRGPRREATARERRKHLSQFLFLRNFQIPVFKYHFEQENDIF